MLRVELETLQADGFSLELVGFSDEELEALLRDPEQVAAGSPTKTPRRKCGDGGDRAGRTWLLGRTVAVRRRDTDDRCGKGHGRRLATWSFAIHRMA